MKGDCIIMFKSFIYIYISAFSKTILRSLSHDLTTFFDFHAVLGSFPFKSIYPFVYFYYELMHVMGIFGYLRRYSLPTPGCPNVFDVRLMQQKTTSMLIPFPF